MCKTDGYSLSSSLGCPCLLTFLECSHPYIQQESYWLCHFGSRKISFLSLTYYSGFLISVWTNFPHQQWNTMSLGKISIQFSSVAQLHQTFWDPMDCSTPGLPVHHQFLDPTQTHVHLIGEAIQPSHPLLSPSLPTFNLSQHANIGGFDMEITIKKNFSSGFVLLNGKRQHAKQSERSFLIKHQSLIGGNAVACKNFLCNRFNIRACRRILNNTII